MRKPGSPARLLSRLPTMARRGLALASLATIVAAHIAPVTLPLFVDLNPPRPSASPSRAV